MLLIDDFDTGDPVGPPAGTRDYGSGVSANEHRLVRPFYLDMMGMNAIERADADLLRRVVAVGQDTSVADVVWLLRGEWRPRVMGAWFSLLHESDAVTRAVLQSLQTSAGSLTAPPLAVAAVLLAEHEAQGALAAYFAQDVLHGWGSAAFASAAIEHLGGQTPMEPSERDRSSFGRLHAIGKAVRDQNGACGRM